MSISKTLEDLEISLLLEAIYQRFGDDFRGYQKEAIRRKLHAFMLVHDISTISTLQDCVLHDPTYIDPLLCALDAHPAGLFDHPKHMRELRKALIPWLRSCPAPKIWIAECSAAEDVYAIAIMLMEEGVYHKTQIFATGANPMLLSEAREAKFSLSKLPQYEENYLRAGGTESLSDYYTQVDDMAVFRNELNRNITWAQYNLGTDSSFNEFELIVCRGSLNDYASRLRRRALQVFYDSLPAFGILSVADADYSDLTPLISRFTALSSKQGLYRKVR
ncbi:chemotaxis protein CheR [Cellvibrio zantedeschiae]|uniref:Chemotaxis protein CheR n=1 Tax=Cellvibrio zantedeschiae TaxID=1237077 RepID=A0ABQ3B0L6_9GAMM|nr:CheR family methyltransferase [Cellvibrio zantedeschiae]GGY73862.1 chemotaxis protein CheR [Cellvibrio zantedeschiae]